MYTQGGIMVRFDKNNWLKTGIEVVDNEPKLSCVVTSKGQSDWSTSSYPNHPSNHSVLLRVHTFLLEARKSVVVENYDFAKKTWEFIRITFLEGAPCSSSSSPSSCKQDQTTFDIGVFSCCPSKNGMKITFENLSMKPCEGYGHNNDGE
eukprot:Awhi_evm2s10078